MSEDFVVHASTEGLRPLGTAPQRSFELVTGTVAARLGPVHAALFAEPISSAHGDSHDWYATVSGTPRLLSDLPEPEQTRTRAELARLVGDIRALAAALSASGAGEDQRLGEALANALEVPGEDCIWVMTGLPEGRLQPVLVNWAWVQDRQEAVRGILSGADTRSRPTPTAPLGADQQAGSGPSPDQPAPVTTRVAANGSRVLWWLVGFGWLVLAAMLAAIVYLALEPCALRLPGRPGYCPAPAAAASDAGLAAARTRLVLEDRILQVERRIGIADRACQPAPVEQAELPPLLPPPPAPTDADERMQASGARLGDLTFTLIWNSPDDLDLHVSCPLGQTVSYRQKAACNGTLDVDSNVRDIVPQPIENVFFIDPANGTYRVAVNYFESRTGEAPQSFELQIRDGDRVETVTGMVSSAQRTWTTMYQTQAQ